MAIATEKTIIGKSRSGYHASRVSMVAGWMAFAFLASMALLDSSFSFGFGFGWKGLLVVIVGLFVSVLASLLAWRPIFGKTFWSFKKACLFFLIVVISGAALDSWLIAYADRRWGVGELLVESRIEYFCLRHFDQRKCVRNVNLCPRCALQFDKWQRDLMVEKLKPYRNQYPESVRAALERRQEARKPAAANSH